ncbi:MAG: LON peptidase substrate-binding domain-containing protein [Spirochaetales bacterium]
MEQTATIPLFPLNVVLFPNQPLPLHIFEPRYKQMVADCLADGRDFGVVLAHQGQLFQNGTCARIENIVERFDDGRLNILTLGKRRFRVQKLLEDKPYLEGEVEFWDDREVPSAAVEQLLRQVHLLVKDYMRITGKIADPSLIENYTPYGFSFFLAEINSYSLTRQQEVLEMNSAEERLLEGLASLTQLVAKLKLDEKLQQLLGSTSSFFNICN